MGLYDTIHVSDEISLPEFEGSRDEIEWQSKSIGRPVMRTFKITSGGRLFRKEVEREQTGERELGVGDETVTLPVMEVVDEWWVDHHQHGSFEFHSYTENYRYSYEARFTKGDLDEIVLLSKTERD